MSKIVDFIEEFISKWQGWVSISAVLVLFVSFIVKGIRDRIIAVCTKYLLANGRRIWYWVFDHPFIVSGFIKFSFPRNISESRELIDGFQEYLNGNDYCDLQGDVRNREITIRLRSLQHIMLTLTFETGQEFLDARPDEMLGNETVEQGGEERGGTEVKIRWDKIQLHYREFSDVLNLLRQRSDEIKNRFVSLVENQASTSQSVHLEVFYRKDCTVNRNRSCSVPVPADRLTMEKLEGVLDIGSSSIDHIIPYLPKYLVKETLESVIKKGY